MRTILVCFVMLALCATNASADEVVDLTGVWDVTRGAPEEKIAGFVLTLKQDGEKLSGTIDWPDGKSTPIADGVAKDGQMSFKVRPNSVTHAYGGEVTADRIKGKWAVTIAVFDWEARRRKAEPLGGPQREAGEKLLATVMQSEDEKTRGAALHELRLLGRRANIVGGKREQRGERLEPQVTGLIPHLARAAATDKAETNRITALLALADTLDPAVVPALRQALRDPSEAVRFQAACLLTEFRDASGIEELKAALKRMRQDPKAAEMSFDLERLLISFERITGRSFGEVPDNPIISSDSRVVETATQRRRVLLEKWAQWWAWEPK